MVTGGNRGIGKAIAWQLAKEGVDVAVVARDRAALETAAAEIARATTRHVKGYVADTGDDAAVKAAVAQLLRRLRPRRYSRQLRCRRGRPMQAANARRDHQ
jgi:NAD(P)-dependent dehydrogenase (short-subunit alcohol dehydrogenase family)